MIIHMIYMWRGQDVPDYLSEVYPFELTFEMFTRLEREYDVAIMHYVEQQTKKQARIAPAKEEAILALDRKTMRFRTIG